MIGIILLTGLVGKNSILVVDYTNNLRSQGLDRNTALLTAGPARLRPILMTSAALIFAQIPLLQLEEGSRSTPSGWVVAGGMATPTLLALIFVPAMYTIIDDFQNWILRSSAGVQAVPRRRETWTAGSAGRISRSSRRPPRSRTARTAARGGALPVGATATIAISGLLVGACCWPAAGRRGGGTASRPRPSPLSVAVTDVQQGLKATFDLRAPPRR